MHDAPGAPSAPLNPTLPEAVPVRLSRRFFMQTAGGAAAAVSAGCATPGAASDSALGPEARPVTLKVNGQPQTLTVAPRVTLLDALRNELALTGTKKGCDRGQCGACTVLLDGQRVNSCLTLVVMTEGREVTTVEGLGAPGTLHPMQQAFVQHDAFQCGYCTPGQVCSAVALVAELRAGTASAATPDVRNPRPALTDDEIRERMSGNLCRCGAYANIVTAVRQVAERGAA